ncbi:uncharacterized protein B0I36DRAFT_331178 [Microdochium trichocladiopsis]|uniref:Uncharacterized protein n=1 Tax=Microdochium trichocladiopsis TaxID=1682393 RepID=A0A9P8Y1E5_9PEZI|nr:uncharacterized protein B0I36DRAFT_331178 [Microdochium trichocladiopsis]KAH7026706.1 hypothetical protein B0I36DRAFT_331178 [Microdochium trichocladiopsis]
MPRGRGVRGARCSARRTRAMCISPWLQSWCDRDLAAEVLLRFWQRWRSSIVAVLFIIVM